MFKKIILPVLLLALFLLIPIKAQAQYLCGGTGLVYSDPVFCQYACGASCEQLNSTTTGESGTCDTTNYEGFVYDANTGFTYAMSVAQNFWTNWTNLATIQNSTDNTALNQIMTYYTISNAWIGAYDPSMSSAYNTNDPQNYVWQSTDTSVSSGYNNWASGQPNNALYQQDIGAVVSNLYGEHWAEMESNGTWNDEGYHYNFPASQNYAPYYNALVQWNGPLSCVDGTVPPSTSTGGTQQQLISTYCNNTTPCYLCTDGTNINECLSGADTTGASAELCPYSQTACTQSTVSATVTTTCPSGGSWNGSECVASGTQTAACPSGFIWNNIINACDSDGSGVSAPNGTQTGYYLVVSNGSIQLDYGYADYRTTCSWVRTGPKISDRSYRCTSIISGYSTAYGAWINNTSSSGTSAPNSTYILNISGSDIQLSGGSWVQILSSGVSAPNGTQTGYYLVVSNGSIQLDYGYADYRTTCSWVRTGPKISDRSYRCTSIISGYSTAYGAWILI